MSLPPIYGEDENPFRLPGDDKIFRMREDEKRRKEEARATNMKLKVWDKNKTEQISRSKRLQDLVGDLAVAKAIDAVKMDDEIVKITVPRRQEKETMPEFIAKKREMFLVQMSLDTKREEIRKLDEKFFAEENLYIATSIAFEEKQDYQSALTYLEKYKSRIKDLSYFELREKRLKEKLTNKPLFKGRRK